MARRLAFAAVWVALTSCGSDAPSTTQPAGGDVDSGAASSGGPSASCVDTINAYRKSVGVAPYARWADGESCADSEAASDSSANKPHGAFGKCGELAQNECPGWDGSADTMIGTCLKAMWAAGPGDGHYEAMRSSKYSQVACGFHTLANGSVWAVQNFR